MSARNQSGFTLIELMVTVAIIAILAVIAIPQYQRYSAKARQTSARTALSAIFTAEQSYGIANTTYSSCLPTVGYKPQGSSYYTTGFVNPGMSSFEPTGPNCGPAGGQACNAMSWNPHVPCTYGNNFTYFNATSDVYGPVSIPSSWRNDTRLSKISKSQFRPVAFGRIYNQYYDIWTMDQDKNLLNTANGIGDDDTEIGADPVVL